MSGGPIDKLDFYSALTDIEQYLGWVKGNELAFNYLWDAEKLAYGKDGSGPDGSIERTERLDEDFAFPVPGYPVKPWEAFEYILYFDDKHAYGPGSPDAWIAQVQKNALVEWHSGVTWASGVANYLGELCQEFMEPDCDALRDTCLDLRNNVFNDLNVKVRDDWANLGNLTSTWHGEAALSFSVFYENYSSAVAIYAMFTGYVFEGMAAATKIINGTQIGALKFVQSVRDALKEQLEAWNQWNRAPFNAPKTPAWLAKTEQLASDAYGLLDDIPVVSTAKGYVDKAVSIGTSIDKISSDLGLNIEPPHTTEHWDVLRADEAYDKLTSTISKTVNDFHTAMNHQVDPPSSSDPNALNLHQFSGGLALQQLQQVKKDDSFSLPYVPPRSLIRTTSTPGHPADIYES